MGVDFRASIIVGYPIENQEIEKELKNHEELEDFTVYTDGYSSNNNCAFGSRLFFTEQTYLHKDNILPIFDENELYFNFKTIQQKYREFLKENEFDIHLADKLPKMYLVQEIQ